MECFHGTLINDTWGEIEQYYNWGITDHHPFFDTLIIGFTICGIAKSTAVTHWQRAFFIFMILQAILTAISFAYTIYYSKKKLNLNNKILTVILAFYCLIPVFPLMVQTVSKDALFSWIYVLFLVNFIELVRTKGDYLKSVKGFICTFIISLLCILTKKVGLYVVLGSYIILLFFEIKRIKKLGFIIIGLLLVSFVIEPKLFVKMNIIKGGKQEMFSLPFQMTANYVKTYPNDVKKDEEKVLEKVLNYDTLAKDYNPVFADPIKGFVQKGEDKDYIDYIKVWIKQGLRHPDSYIKATGAMFSGIFSFEEYKPLTDMEHHTQLNPDIFDENAWIRSERFQKSSNFISKVYDNFYNIKFIGKIFSWGFFTVLIPMFCFITLFKYRKNNNKIHSTLIIIPLVLSVLLGICLAPVNAANLEGKRYLYPIIYTLPMTIMWCFYCIKNNLELKNENLNKGENDE